VGDLYATGLPLNILHVSLPLPFLYESTGVETFSAITVTPSRVFGGPSFSAYINSLYGRKYISSVVSGHVGQAKVNGAKSANMPVPLPPLEEQQRIVAGEVVLIRKANPLHGSL
jgi:hypothetical protein